MASIPSRAFTLPSLVWVAEWERNIESAKSVYLDLQAAPILREEENWWPFDVGGSFT